MFLRIFLIKVDRTSDPGLSSPVSKSESAASPRGQQAQAQESVLSTGGECKYSA